MNSKLLCNYPFTHFEVNNPNGDVTVCCDTQYRIMGNVNEQSIEEIWNGEKYQQVRKNFLDGKICNKNCPVIKGWKDYQKLDWYKKLPEDSEVYKNAKLNQIEIAAGKIILESKPRWIRFATSYRCNLQCYHCSQRQSKEREKNNSLPESFFVSLKDNNLKYAQIVFFFGGEPFVEKRNIELLDSVGEQNKDCRIFIITNGTILNSRIKYILKKIDIGLLDISIDSISKELYEELRYPAKWDLLKENLDFYSELMKKKNGFFQIGMTVNKKNKNELTDYLKFALNLGAIPNYRFVLNNHNNKIFRKKYEIFYPDEYKEIIPELYKLKQSVHNKELFMPERNITDLIEIAENKIIDNTPIKRTQNFIKNRMRFGYNKFKSYIKYIKRTLKISHYRKVFGKVNFDDYYIKIINKQYKHKVLFIAGLPKSGTTWLNNILCLIRGYNNRDFTDSDKCAIEHDICDELFQSLPADQYSILKLHTKFSKDNFNVIKRHVDKFIVMYRDPRDQALSNYFHCKNNPLHRHYKLYNKISLNEGITHTIIKTKNHYISWIKDWKKIIEQKSDMICEVKYEDLNLNTAETVKRVLDFFEIKVSSSVFNKMLNSKIKKEQNLRTELKKSNSTRRKGVVGDWKNYFQEGHKKIFKNMAGKFLIELGYEKDLDW